MTPDLGQGACLAVEDGVALAACLARDQPMVTSLRSYESQRALRTAAIVALSRWLGQLGQIEDFRMYWVRDLLIKTVSSVGTWAGCFRGGTRKHRRISSGA